MSKTINLTLLVFLGIADPITAYSQASSTGKKGATSATNSTADTSTDKAKQTGQQIGTLVSSAVDTAFPIIGKIMDLFAGSKKPKQDDVAAAVKKAQTEFVTSAKLKLQPAATISKELAVIQTFGIAGVSATENIANINRLMQDKSPNYGKVALEWKIAKSYLADVLVMKQADVQAVREPTIQERIVTLQNARKDLMLRIDDNIANAQKKPDSISRQELSDQITAMAGLLKGFNTLAAIELATLQSDIDDLAKWANSPAGQNGFAPKPPNAKLLRLVDNSAQSAKDASTKK